MNDESTLNFSARSKFVKFPQAERALARLRSTHRDSIRTGLGKGLALLGLSSSLSALVASTALESIWPGPIRPKCCIRTIGVVLGVTHHFSCSLVDVPTESDHALVNRRNLDKTAVFLVTNPDMVQLVAVPDLYGFRRSCTLTDFLKLGRVITHASGFHAIVVDRTFISSGQNCGQVIQIGRQVNGSLRLHFFPDFRRRFAGKATMRCLVVNIDYPFDQHFFQL